MQGQEGPVQASSRPTEGRDRPRARSQCPAPSGSLSLPVRMLPAEIFRPAPVDTFLDDDDLPARHTAADSRGALSRSALGRGEGFRHAHRLEESGAARQRRRNTKGVLALKGAKAAREEAARRQAATDRQAQRARKRALVS